MSFVEPKHALYGCMDPKGPRVGVSRDFCEVFGVGARMTRLDYRVLLKAGIDERDPCSLGLKDASGLQGLL